MKGSRCRVKGLWFTVRAMRYNLLLRAQDVIMNQWSMIFVLCWCRVQACTTGENIRLRVEGLDFYRRWGLEWQVTSYGFRVKGNG